jgi:hypothetical protein
VTPKRLLNSKEAGQKLGGLSAHAVTQRLERPQPTIPEPDFVIGHGGKDIAGWLPGNPALVPARPAPDDVALVADPASLPDEFLIGPRQFAHLAGWSLSHLKNMRSDGRLPDEDEKRGQSPRWRMGTYRAWAGQQETRAERDAKIAAEWKRGRLSQREIGKLFGLSLSRVHDIIAASGATRGQGKNVSEEK